MTWNVQPGKSGTMEKWNLSGISAIGEKKSTHDIGTLFSLADNEYIEKCFVVLCMNLCSALSANPSTFHRLPLPSQCRHIRDPAQVSGVCVCCKQRLCSNVLFSVLCVPMSCRL